MLGGILNVFRVPEIRSKLLITLGFLLVYRIGWNIPLPGIDLGAIKDALGQGEEQTFAQLFNLISGGGIYSFAVFSLGIMPYISSSIIFSLLVKVVPSLEAIAKEGAAGQRKINQWTRLATVPICRSCRRSSLVANVYTKPMTPSSPVGSPARRARLPGRHLRAVTRADRRHDLPDVDRRADHRVRRRQRHLAPDHGGHHRARCPTRSSG